MKLKPAKIQNSKRSIIKDLREAEIRLEMLTNRFVEVVQKFQVIEGLLNKVVDGAATQEELEWYKSIREKAEKLAKPDSDTETNEKQDQ